jgi:hypothetical protein
MDEEGQAAGRFFYYNKEQYFVFGETKISIEVISRLFRKDEIYLLESATNNRKGSCEIFGRGGIDVLWEDIPSTPAGVIHFNDKKYNFRRIVPAVQYSYSDKETWDYFRYRLYAVKGNEFYDYSLKMSVPVWSNHGHISKSPFIGQIESNSDNILLILAGIYLMEVLFERQDND